MMRNPRLKQDLPGQSLGSNLTHIDLSPQGCDGSTLSICPLDHVNGVKVFFDLNKLNKFSDSKPLFEC